MARLQRRPVAEILADRLETARAAATEWGHVVVLKGAPTVIAAPDGRTTTLPLATPALASAGTGDILAGLIAGLLAQGAPAYEAAVAGAVVHGLAGQRTARELGERAPVAPDLLARIAPELVALEAMRDPHAKAVGGPAAGLLEG
jgi:NAD(P)H-hydrate epimerase